MRAHIFAFLFELNEIVCQSYYSYWVILISRDSRDSRIVMRLPRTEAPLGIFCGSRDARGYGKDVEPSLELCKNRKSQEPLRYEAGGARKQFQIIFI